MASPRLDVTAGPLIDLPSVPQLTRELGRLADADRATFLERIKEVREREWRHLYDFQVARINEVSGIDVCANLCAIVDAFLRSSLGRGAERVDLPPDWRERFGCFAIGGYGRGEFNPRSDIDLVCATVDAEIPPWAKELYAEFELLLWDAGFKVGGSLRSFAELGTILDDDFVTATAVIEQRPLDAASPIRAEMESLLERFRRRRAKPFIAYKIEELAQRRERVDSPLALEPDLKGNPGCLRDVQFLRNICFAVLGGTRNLLGLLELGGFTRDDVAAIVECNDRLLAIRSLQHFHHGRSQDAFELNDQVRIARQMGYSASGPLRGVELLMRDLYAGVMHVHQMVQLCKARLKALGHHGKKRFLIARRRKLAPGFVVIDGEVFIADRDFWSQGAAVPRLFAVCRLAQDRGHRLGLELQRGIRRHLHLVRPELRADPRIARDFMAMMGALGKVAPILFDMHHAGLLGEYLPEFGHVTCHMQFNSYHHYTVDEHTLIGLRHLDAVARGDEPGLAEMPEILRRTRHRAILGLALLLHDVGKYMGSGHVRRGAMMVGPVADRLGLDREEEEMLHFLVIEHVTLSDASRMRDITDPQFLATTAAQMGTPERLELLYCLTYADAKAVGPGILTGWQEELLVQLFRSLREQLEEGGAAPVTVRESLQAELVAAGCDALAVEELLARMPDNYPFQVLAEDAPLHLECLAADDDGFACRHRPREESLALSLVCPDRRGLMSDVAGVLAGYGLDIIEFRAWRLDRGGILFSMRLKSFMLARWQEDDAWIALERDLRRCAREPIDVEGFLERRRAMIEVDTPADSGFEDIEIRIDRKTSETSAILDVKASDRVGMLSILARIITDAGCNIDYACINTQGDVAIDVFYVSKDGRKLGDDEAVDLRSRVEDALASKVA